MSICEDLVLLYFVAAMSFRSAEKIRNKQLIKVAGNSLQDSRIGMLQFLQVYQSVMLK